MKILIIALVISTVFACTPRVSRRAAQVAYHHDMSTLLSDCERLGPVTGEYEAKLLLTENQESYRAELALTEAAIDKYGPAADNVVFISTIKVTEGKNTTFAQGAAFHCKS